MLNKTINNITLVISKFKQNSNVGCITLKSCYIAWTCWHK